MSLEKLLNIPKEDPDQEPEMKKNSGMRP
jgi:hypothetical protein